jgi:hypothetical protein
MPRFIRSATTAPPSPARRTGRTRAGAAAIWTRSTQSTGLASSEATLAASDAELADDQVSLFLARGDGWDVAAMNETRRTR